MSHAKRSIAFYDLFLSWQGCISRATFGWGTLFLVILYMNGYLFIDLYCKQVTSQPMYWSIPFYWFFWVLAIKRNHDFNRSGLSLLWFLIPVLGPIFVFYRLFFKKNSPQISRFGERLEDFDGDYLKNPDLLAIKNLTNKIVNDVTQFNPIVVKNIITPISREEIIDVLKNSKEPISIGGGR